MKLASFDANRVGVVIGDHGIVDVTNVIEVPDDHPDAMRELITEWTTLRGDVEKAAEGPATPLASVTLDSPVRRPRHVIAAPINYRDHQYEMQQRGDVSHLGVFLKSPGSVTRPHGVVRLPYSDRRFDQEGEFAAVIGSRASRVPVESALDYVFGYTGLLDITMRGGEDRSTRKSFETFTPVGPWVVTADELGDPTDVDLQCTVAGEVRQTANTRDLIWSVADLVSYASSIFTLEPGDVITTGTPAGVGPLQDGDQVVLDLARIGRLSVTVSSDGAVVCPTLGASSGPLPR